ncbi:hypothetical protein [uncultured Polaribacter sp.]|uniref:hypothetical protein n=1 Tax=uncultured Polaribacter sp. TaxID=174711 RepID=UPI002617465B|nr:hypothetical protein [uncultured Polaribacter sp.]
MKKHILLLVLLISTSYTYCQVPKESKDKIRTLKVAYITEQLELTANTAQKFWPVYNAHDYKTNKFIRRKIEEIKREIKQAGGVQNLDDKKAKELFDNIRNLQKKKYEEEEKYIAKLKEILSIKQILNLQVSEREFTRKLMRKYGKRNKE